jgi:hypothetical protein
MYSAQSVVNCAAMSKPRMKSEPPIVLEAVHQPDERAMLAALLALLGLPEIEINRILAAEFDGLPETDGEKDRHVRT